MWLLFRVRVLVLVLRPLRLRGVRLLVDLVLSRLFVVFGILGRLLLMACLVLVARVRIVLVVRRRMLLFVVMVM